MIISIALQALTGSFDTDIARSSKAAQKQLQDLERQAVKLAAVSTAAFIGAATGLAVLVKNSINYADEISKTSQKVGLTTEQLSGLTYAAKLSDVEFDQLTSGLVKFNKAQIDAINGSAAQTAAFKSVGISINDLKTSNPEQLLLKVADAFSKSTDSASKTAIAVALFGRAGANLIPLLDSGSVGIKELTDEAAKFGLVIGSDTAKAAEEFNDNLTRIHAQVQGLGLEIASNALPQLLEFEKKLQDPAVREGISALAQGILTLTTYLGEAAADFGNFGKQLGFVFASASGQVSQLDDVAHEIELVDKALTSSFLFKPSKYLYTSEDDLNKIKAGLELGKKILEQQQNIKANTPASATTAANQPQGVLSAPATPVDRSALFSAQLKASLSILAEGLKQQQKVNQDFYDNGLISANEYYAAKLSALKSANDNETKEIKQNIDQVRKQQAADDLGPQQAVALQAKLVGLYGQLALAEKKAADEALNLQSAQENQTDSQIKALSDIAIAANDAAVKSGIQRKADDLADARSKQTISNQQYYDGLAELENESYKENIELVNQQLYNFEGSQDQQIIALAEANAKKESLSQEHENTLNKIKKEGELSRTQIGQAGLTVAGNLLGALADAQDKNSKEGFERYKKFAIASAIISTINGAISAYSSTLAIPVVGPVLAPIAAATALIAGYAQINNIRSQQFSGRAIGGPVNAGGMYEVNENGPELLQYGNKTLLMMGDKSGNVIPAKPGGAANDSNGNVNLTVEIHGSNGPATATAEQTDQGTLIRVAVNGAQAALQKDIASGGPTSKLLQQTYTLKRAGR